MAFCSNCGNQLGENDKFCTHCGVEINAAPKEEPKTEPKMQTSTILDTPEFEVNTKDAEDHKWMAILAYINLLFLIPLLAAPDSKFARFHANQGLVLFLTSLIGSAVAVIPILGWLAAVVINLAAVVWMVLGIVNAYNGKAKELPIIGSIKIIK